VPILPFPKLGSFIDPKTQPAGLLDLDSPDPLKRDLAYLKLLEELLGPEWVERWALERGKLEALREWRHRELLGRCCQ